MAKKTRKEIQQSKIDLWTHAEKNLPNRQLSQYNPEIDMKKLQIFPEIEHKVPFSIEKLDFDLRDKQNLAIEALKKNEDVLAILPTSYGKTILAQFLAQKTLDGGKKFIIMGPLRALVEEQEETFAQNFKVLKVSGDHQKNKKRMSGPDIDGLISTYEMVYQILLHKDRRDSLLNQYGALIIDVSVNPNCE